MAYKGNATAEIQQQKMMQQQTCMVCFAMYITNCFVLIKAILPDPGSGYTNSY